MYKLHMHLKVYLVLHDSASCSEHISLETLTAFSNLILNILMEDILNVFLLILSMAAFAFHSKIF